MMINADKRNQSGVTLIELMFGVVVVSIAVLALYQMFITGTGMITEEYHRRLALEKAQAKMEMAKFYETQSDTVPQSLSGTFMEELVPPEGNSGEGIQATYTILVSQSQTRNRYGIPIYSYVSLSYNWTEYSGKEQNITLQTYF